jgi:diguanylate cyclase (GGDEF)-like protein
VGGGLHVSPLKLRRSHVADGEGHERPDCDVAKRRPGSDVVKASLAAARRSNRRRRVSIPGLLHYAGEKDWRLELAISIHLLDELSRVYKREYVLARLHQECRRARRSRRPVAFLLVDVDNFGAWNRSAGAGEGDSLLQKVAGTILANVRETDLVGRFADDEFCIVLPETGLQAALVAAERVRRVVEAEFLDGAKPFPITVSIGVAALSEPKDMDSDIIISEAGVALRHAKARGRNCVKLSPETIPAGKS